MVRSRGATAAASIDRFVKIVADHGLVVELPQDMRPWFTTVDPKIALVPGQAAPEPMRIPQADASRLLKGIIRFVADLPVDASLVIIWQHDPNELAVDAGSIDLVCTAGVITVRLTVTCDQLERPVTVAVPFGVGRADATRGLLMSSFTRVDAPPAVAEGWSDAIIAFCWEALLELATRLSRQAGNDAAGQPLIPGTIAADDGLLIVQPMARHDLSALTR